MKKTLGKILWLTVLGILILGILTTLYVSRNFDVKNSENQPENEVTTFVNSVVDESIVIMGFEDTQITLETAKSFDKRAEGLMFRQYMDEDKGMIFIYNTERTLAFYMKNTYIPLDIIFLDQNFEVVDFYTETETNQTHTTYTSRAPAQFAVELNAGWAAEKGLKVGDKFELISWD